MSAYSTINITRSKAIETMIRQISSGVSDETLEEFMDVFLRARLYNVRIVPDDSENDNDVV